MYAVSVKFHDVNLVQIKMKKMKKLIVFGAILALGTSITSCGGGEDAEGKEPKTVEFTANSQSFQLGEFDVVVTVGKYVDNYTSDAIKSLIGEGKKVVQLEIDVLNNSDLNLILPPAGFTLDKISTDKREDIGVSNLIAMKLDDYNMYDGDVGPVRKTGVLYFELDADEKVSDYQLNVRNVLREDGKVGSISLKQGDRKDAAADTEIKLTNASFEFEDVLFDGKATFKVDKVVDNYQGGEGEANAYEKKVLVEYTITCESGKVYVSDSDLMMSTDLLKNPIFSSESEVENGALEGGNSVSGTAVFEIPTGDANYTLVYSDDYKLPLK